MGRRLRIGATIALAAGGCGGGATPTPSSTELLVRRVVDTGGPETSVRLVRDTVSNALYALKLGGDVLRLTLPAQGTGSVETLFRAADTGVASPQGVAFGAEGTLYLVGNETSGLDNFALIRRGTRAGGHQRVWSTLARTALYPRSNTAFDHQFNGIAVSPDGRFVYVNSGSRTDHGEVQTSGGRYPGLRETALTARIFRLPANGAEIFLPDDEAVLQNAGYVFARGVRNSFDPAFNAAGDLLPGNNSRDRAASDQPNRLRHAARLRS